MHPLWLKKQHKEKILRAAIDFLSRPVLHDWRDDEYEKQLGEAESFFRAKITHEEKAAELSETHLLSQRTKALGEKAGVDVRGVFLNASRPYYNAGVDYLGGKAAFITFYGDPLLLPEGEKYLEAAVGHELSHVLQNSAGLLIKQDKAARQYRWIGGGLAFTGRLVMVLAGTPWLLAPSAVFAVIGSIGLPMLGRAHMRNEEYIADIQGVEITGKVDSSVFDLRNHAAATDVVPPPLQATGSLDKIKDFVWGNPYPSTKDRIRTLQTVFNVRDKETPPAARIPPRALSP